MLVLAAYIYFPFLHLFFDLIFDVLTVISFSVSVLSLLTICKISLYIKDKSVKAEFREVLRLGKPAKRILVVPPTYL